MYLTLLILGILGLIGFLVLFAISASKRKPLGIPISGAIFFSAILLIGLSMSLFKVIDAVSLGSNTPTENAEAAQLKEIIDKNIAGMDKREDYSIKITELTHGEYAAEICLNVSSAEPCPNVAKNIIGSLISCRPEEFQKIRSMTFVVFPDSGDRYTLEVSDTKLITSQDNILKYLVLRDSNGKVVPVKSEEELQREKQAENERLVKESAENFKRGMEAFNKKQYQSALELLVMVSTSDPNYNKAFECAGEAYRLMPITSDSIASSKNQLGKWFVVDVINFKINSIRAAKEIRGYSPHSGNVLLVLDVSVKNMTGQGKIEDGYGQARNITVNSLTNFRLSDSDNHTYNDLLISGNTLNSTLSSGSEARGELVYEIPVSMGIYKFEGMMNNLDYGFNLNLK